jgi:hypothetical protein
MWLRDGPDEFTTETMSAEHTDLPISRLGVLCLPPAGRRAPGSGIMRSCETLVGCRDA